MPLKIWFRGGVYKKTYAGEGLMFKRECLKKEGPGEKGMAKKQIGACVSHRVYEVFCTLLIKGIINNTSIHVFLH